MSGIKDFKKVANANEETSKLQERLQEYFQPITRCPIIDGTLLTNVSLVTGSVNNVPHLLGRTILGYIIVRNRSQSQIWDSQDANIFAKKTLALNTSANTTVDIWVF